jgi:hypothetical protein
MMEFRETKKRFKEARSGAARDRPARLCASPGVHPSTRHRHHAERQKADKRICPVGGLLLICVLRWWGDEDGAMSVAATRPPKSAVAALESMLGAYLRGMDAAKASAYKPVGEVPVFVIDQVDPVSADDLERLKPAAWRFVLSHQPAGEYATGDVTAKGGAYELSMVTTNRARAEQLLIYIDSAKQQARVTKPKSDRLKLRMLEAPAFRMRAIWLRARPQRCVSHDLFSVVRGSAPLSFVTPEKFLELVNGALSATLGENGQARTAAQSRP